MRSSLKRLLRTIVILAVLSCNLVPAISSAQIKIVADTIMGVGCKYDGPVDLVIETQEVYDNATFLLDNEWCLPFDDIDFTKNFLIGCRYPGSNCDKGIVSSNIVETDTGYLIQFAIPASPCRDSATRTVWFVVEKPTGDVEFTFERVVPQMNKP